MKWKTVLLTNDDGFRAPGISALAGVLTRICRVFVVAPLDERSACSRAMTIGKPVAVHETGTANHFPGAAGCYIVDGMPVDCVKLGLNSLISEPVDLVISGINRGINTGIDVHYSGTAGAAIEGHLMGKNAVAFSLDNDQKNADFSVAAGICLKVLDWISQLDAERFLFNVNIPDLPEADIAGLRVTRCNHFSYAEKYRIDRSREHPCYFLEGERTGFENDPDTDLTAVMRGYVSITPLNHDNTDHAVFNKYKGEKP
ncbi:MAG: 5'/3'-nucleotidase SurE [Candidatus Wallbacteria bacterium]|nr:5'/3'-nucleotidase SurE [Candidatus Wallbacteria bacterium]